MKTEMENYLASIQGRVVAGTIEQRRICLVLFVEFLEKNEIAYQEIEPIHLDRFAQHLSAHRTNLKGDAPISQGRVQRYLQTAGIFLHYLYRQQKILQDFRFYVKAPTPQPKIPFVPSHSQVQKLLELPDLATPLGLRDRAMFETVYSCGLRLGELHQLRLADLDLDSELLVVVRGKGGKGRYLPLGRWAIHYLYRYITEARPLLTKGSHQGLWLSAYGRPLASTISIQQRFIRYEKRLNFPVSCHTLRHAFATRMLEGGANLRQVQQLLGHQHLSTTKRYTEVRPAFLQQAHRRAHPRG